MIKAEYIEPFYHYLKPVKGTWLERGLVENAPPEAVKAFEKFKELKEKAKKMGLRA